MLIGLLLASLMAFYLTKATTCLWPARSISLYRVYLVLFALCSVAMYIAIVHFLLLWFDAMRAHLTGAPRFFQYISKTGGGREFAHLAFYESHVKQLLNVPVGASFTRKQQPTSWLRRFQENVLERQKAPFRFNARLLIAVGVASAWVFVSALSICAVVYQVRQLLRNSKKRKCTRAHFLARFF